LTITGSVVNCNAATVTNGYVDVLLEGIHNRVLVKNDGTFSITFSRCTPVTATATLIAYDLGVNQIGTATNLPVSTGTANAGQLVACGNTVAEYTNYVLNNVSYNFAKPADSIVLVKSWGTSYTLYTRYKGASSPDNSYVGFTPSATGTIPLDFATIHTSAKTWYLTGGGTINITEFGAIGTGYVAGNFTTILKDTLSSQTAPVNFTFRIKRTQ
jgi:hypothetical protein